MGHTSGKSILPYIWQKEESFYSSFIKCFFCFVLLNIFKSGSLAVQLGRVKIQKPVNKHPDFFLTLFF